MAETRSQVYLLRFARTGSWLVMLIGLLVLAGWVLNLPRLTSLSRQWVPMNPTTAVLLVLCGIALRRFAMRYQCVTVDWPGLLCGATVALCGAIKLSEYFLGLNVRIDELLFASQMMTEEQRMAPNSAFNFLLFGIGLVIIDAENRHRFRPAQACFLITAMVSLLALIGYMYRVLELYRIGSAPPMAFTTALAFTLASLIAIAARPSAGVMRVITSDTTAGATARRLLPAAVLIPLVLGAVRFTGERHGILDAEFSVSLFAVAIMLMFTILIWWNSRLLFSAEVARARVERRLAVQYGATRVLAEAHDFGQATHRIMKGICDRLGWQAGELWKVDNKSMLIRCEEVYVTSPEFSDFAECTRKLSFSKGTGLPGEIWDRREPRWIEDVSADPLFSRSLAVSRAGLHAVVAVPIRYNGTVCGVMEFLSVNPEPPDEPLLQTLAAVGTQIGQFAERLVADEQLRKTSADLERSNTELQQFAYVASHDLTEPLRMIVSYLQLLQHRHQDKLDAEATEFVGYALDGARRMNVMIQDLLAYARVDSRARPLQPTDCESVLTAALLNLKVSIDESGAEIQHERLPTVMGDAIQLTVVFQNLVSNAIKFRGDAPPRIRIQAQRREHEWIFSVSDRGIGIDPKYFERIFVIFQRLHTRQEYPGTGIGLALCKKIIDRHGGRIWVESEPGQGTIFWFSLPAAD